jgi:hypothetical protein
MADVLSAAPYSGVNTPYKRGSLQQVVLTFVNGVPTISTSKSAPGFTITGDAGVYTGTMPKCPKAILLIQPLTASVAAIATVTTIVPTSGTFSFKTFTDAGAALDVATGDEVHLLFMLEGG